MRLEYNYPNVPVLLRNLVIAVMLLATGSCTKKDFLKEKPLDFLSADNVLTSKKGFESYLYALHYASRDELVRTDVTFWLTLQHCGTDITCNGDLGRDIYSNWVTFLTPTNTAIRDFWNWAYIRMLSPANTIIAYASKPELESIWSSEAEKNQIIAEARFFRAYTHNFLANTFGSVPVVDTVYSGPKTDFMRNTRQEVYESAKADLEFASQWLPETVSPDKEGRIVKAAADHLLAEVYISLGLYDKAITSASNVINSGLYELVTERFGSDIGNPGDYYSDIFKTGNQNRSSGNKETIWVWQFEDETPGGNGTRPGGNISLRAWMPWYINARDPDGKTGMVLVDSLGRGVGAIRPTNYFLYDLWQSDWDNDIRNSRHNIRRTFYYNNPESAWFGKPVLPEYLTTAIDTMRYIYPAIRKVEGNISWLKNVDVLYYGSTSSDFIVYRLAETYLLRAEAYMRKGDLENAAKDINVVRERAKASPVNSEDVNIDYILDERARELITEEPRHRTLVRTGKLVERVRKYNMREDSRTTIQEHHIFWPIPQDAIDANFSADLGQNPGY